MSGCQPGMGETLRKVAGEEGWSRVGEFGAWVSRSPECTLESGVRRPPA